MSAEAHTGVFFLSVICFVLAFTMTDKTRHNYTDQQIVLSVVLLTLTLNMLSQQELPTKKLMFIICTQCFSVCIVFYTLIKPKTYVEMD